MNDMTLIQAARPMPEGRSDVHRERDDNRRSGGDEEFQRLVKKFDQPAEEPEPAKSNKERLTFRSPQTEDAPENLPAVNPQLLNQAPPDLGLGGTALKTAQEPPKAPTNAASSPPGNALGLLLVVPANGTPPGQQNGFTPPGHTIAPGLQEAPPAAKELQSLGKQHQPVPTPFVGDVTRTAEPGQFGPSSAEPLNRLPNLQALTEKGKSRDKVSTGVEPALSHLVDLKPVAKSATPTTGSVPEVMSSGRSSRDDLPVEKLFSDRSAPREATDHHGLVERADHGLSSSEMASGELQGRPEVAVRQVGELTGYGNKSIEPKMVVDGAKNPSPGEQVSVWLTQGLADGKRAMRLRLHPEELGTVDIKVSWQSGRLSAQFTVDRLETLDMLQRDARAIEQALTTVGASVDSRGLSFQLRQHDDGRSGHQPPFDSRNQNTVGEQLAVESQVNEEPMSVMRDGIISIRV